MPPSWTDSDCLWKFASLRDESFPAYSLCEPTQLAAYHEHEAHATGTQFIRSMVLSLSCRSGELGGRY